jgi:hypothetical protein
MFTLQRVVYDNSNSNNKKEIIVHCVLVVCIMLWVVCQCVVTYRSNYYSNVNTIIKSDYIYNGEYAMSNSNGIRNLSDNDEDSMILNIQRYIFSQVLSGRMFVGKWNANTNTNKSSDITTLIVGFDNGKVHLKLSSVFDLINNNIPLLNHTPSNLMEYVQYLLIENNLIVEDSNLETSLVFVFSIVSIAIKLVYLLVYSTVIRFVYWIITSIIWGIFFKDRNIK